MFPVFFIVVASALFAQQDLNREMIAVEIQKHFDSPAPPLLFSEEIEGSEDLTRRVNIFFKENFLYIDWLSRESKDHRERLVDSVCDFLEAQNLRISDRRKTPKKAITLDELKAVAVRNIYPSRITTEGKLGTSICASAVGFRDYGDRFYELEAFAFQTVFNDVKKPESFILAQIGECTKTAKSLKLSTHDETLLKRAQGVFWALFYKNPDFEKLLLDAYQEKATYLPFEIK